MPNYFNLTRKGDTQHSSASEVDEKLCEHLGVPCDPVKYVLNWYDTIGFALAMGVPLTGARADGRTMENTFGWKELLEKNETYSGKPLDAEGREFYTQRLKVLEYLRENYTSESWAMIGSGR